MVRCRRCKNLGHIARVCPQERSTPQTNAGHANAQDPYTMLVQKAYRALENLPDLKAHMDADNVFTSLKSKLVIASNQLLEQHTNNLPITRASNVGQYQEVDEALAIVLEAHGKLVESSKHCYKYIRYAKDIKNIKKNRTQAVAYSNRVTGWGSSESKVSAAKDESHYPVEVKINWLDYWKEDNELRCKISQLLSTQKGSLTTLCKAFDQLSQALQLALPADRRLAQWLLYIQAFCERAAVQLRQVMASINERFEGFLQCNEASKAICDEVAQDILMSRGYMWHTDVVKRVKIHYITFKRKLAAEAKGWTNGVFHLEDDFRGNCFDTKERKQPSPLRKKEKIWDAHMKIFQKRAPFPTFSPMFNVSWSTRWCLHWSIPAMKSPFPYPLNSAPALPALTSASVLQKRKRSVTNEDGVPQRPHKKAALQKPLTDVDLASHDVASAREMVYPESLLVHTLHWQSVWPQIDPDETASAISSPVAQPEDDLPDQQAQLDQANGTAPEMRESGQMRSGSRQPTIDSPSVVVPLAFERSQERQEQAKRKFDNEEDDEEATRKKMRAHGSMATLESSRSSKKSERVMSLAKVTLSDALEIVRSIGGPTPQSERWASPAEVMNILKGESVSKVAANNTLTQETSSSAQGSPESSSPRIPELDLSNNTSLVNQGTSLLPSSQNVNISTFHVQTDIKSTGNARKRKMEEADTSDEETARTFKITKGNDGARRKLKAGSRRLSVSDSPDADSNVPTPAASKLSQGAPGSPDSGYFTSGSSPSPILNPGRRRTLSSSSLTIDPLALSTSSSSPARSSKTSASSDELRHSSAGLLFQYNTLEKNA